jgi:tripartite-type tricarboxylate transporter receptor subunit TctC
MWQEDTRAIGISKFLKVKTWQDFVARSKEKPILVGTGGAGTSQHIDPLMIEAVSDLNFKYIHYPGSSQTAPAMGRNEVEMEVAQVATTEQLNDNGLGRTFCVLSKERSPFAPNVPTALEVGMPEEQFQKLMDAPFFGATRVIAAPPGTDPEIVKILRKAMWDTFTDPKYLEQLEILKGDNNPLSGEAYQKVIMRKLKAAQENQKMIDVIKIP